MEALILGDDLMERRTAKYLGLLAALSASAFGGQSILLSTQTASNGSIPAQRAGNAWRVEFSIHDWDSNFSPGHPLGAAAVGADIQFLNLGGGDLRLQIYSASTSGGNVCQIPGLGPGGPSGGGTLYMYRFLTVRYQEVPSQLTDYCQAWDALGNLVFNVSSMYGANSGSNNPGGTVASTGQNLSTAYFRIYTSTVPTNARPPVTADTTQNCLVFWKFDNGNNTGSLNDSCTTGPYPAMMSSGSPTYVNTPYQNQVIPVLRTPNAPVWGNTASLRAGNQAQLDGTQSYSQADASASVQCSWETTSGPSTATWVNRNSCTPTVSGMIFGDYTFQLVGTDAAGVQGTVSQDLGAVATDSNGVVVNANPLVDFLFGPMIALGKNPWGYQDYWALRATTLRSADYANTVTSQGLSYPGWTTNGGKPQWETPGQGTVKYNFNCVGPPGFCDRSSMTLSAPLNATDTSVTVSSTSRLDLSSFPTRILVWDGSNWDELRICSAASNVLTLCYDPSALPRHSFASGSNVMQSKVSGTGTKFVSDPTAPICPVGAPGLPGVSAYSTGTVALTAGSTAMTGSGTAWASPLVSAGEFVQVSATHSGMPFVFMAQIASVGSGTGVILSRPFPSDADTASGLSYNIMPASRTAVMHYTNLYTDPTYDSTGDSLEMFGTTGCESETAFYLNPLGFGLGNSFASGHDIAGLDGVLESGRQYSITDTTGWVNSSSTGGINFYGEDVAHWALYYRSGLGLALTTARSISNYWIHSPWGNADGNGSPRLFLGGAGLGAWISYLTDPSTKVSISSLRGYSSLGASMVSGIASGGCNAVDDTRDTGWAYLWLIMGAIFDPDTASTSAPGGISWRAYWQSFLPQMRTNDTNCQQADHSWSNGFLWNSNQTGPLALTNGSTTVTGTSIPSSVCAGIGTGTGSVTAGSATFTVATGALTPSNGDHTLILNGTLGGAAFTGSYLYNYSGSGTASLAALWPGDTGSVTWMSSSANVGNTANALTTIATSNDDVADLKNNYACMWNSSTALTLDHPWKGATGSNYRLWASNLAGYGQDTFMVGIKTLSMNYLAKQTSSALSAYVAPYDTFTNNAATWINTTGFDPNTKGMNYGTVYQFCTPTTTAAGTFDGRTPGCNYGLNTNAQVAARELNAETGTAASLFYEYNPSPANLAWADTVYGALWGFCPWTTGGVYCDATSPASNPGSSNLLDSYIHGGKWTGFFAGAGMSHRWPAARLGGVQAARPRTVLVSFDLGSVAGAVSARVALIAPSSARTMAACAASPCAVTVDDRQGADLFQIQYLGASGQVLTQSDPDLLR